MSRAEAYQIIKHQRLQKNILTSEVHNPITGTGRQQSSKAAELQQKRSGFQTTVSHDHRLWN
jgi:hypothetical protein